mgnify:CR=1 FL=1
MTFKKLVLGLLSFVAVFTLVACSSSNSKNLQDDIKEKKLYTQLFEKSTVKPGEKLTVEQLLGEGAADVGTDA